MKKIRTIRIIHDITYRIEFLFFAEFFRMCGVYVGEYIYDKNHQNREIDIETAKIDEEFDVNFYVGEEKNGEIPLGVLPENTVYFREICTDFSVHIFECENDLKKEILFKVIEGIDFLSDEAKVFKNIGKIYIDNGLMLHLANQQYYKTTEKIHNKSIKPFEEAYGSLWNICNISNVRYLYAKLYCACKANLACKNVYHIVRYEISDLVKECQEILERDSEFYNIWVLIGLIYEAAPECGRQAITSFSNALNKTKLSAYSFRAQVYYYMGKRYEPYKANREHMKECFKKSFENKPRYRNLYKLALIDYQEEKYDSALEKFQFIERHLEIKKNAEYLDPLEVEYCYKISSLSCFIYCNALKQYNEAVSWGEKACAIYEKIGNNIFYKDFYGEDAIKYVGISRSRMNLKKVYFSLAVSYQKIGNIKEAEDYMEKYNKNV